MFRDGLGREGLLDRLPPPVAVVLPPEVVDPPPSKWLLLPLPTSLLCSNPGPVALLPMFRDILAILDLSGSETPPMDDGGLTRSPAEGLPLSFMLFRQKQNGCCGDGLRFHACVARS